MPVYGFICENCNVKFDSVLTIANREKPIGECCEKCGSNSIQRDFGNQTSALLADSTLTPNKKTGGAWNELMAKIKPGLPKYTHGSLDNATNRTSRRWQQ
jgi:putative FmdB family regulatory protein